MALQVGRYSGDNQRIFAMPSTTQWFDIRKVGSVWSRAPVAVSQSRTVIVVWARDDLLAVGWEDYWRNKIGVALERLEQGSCSSIPEPYCLIWARDDLLAIGWEVATEG